MDMQVNQTSWVNPSGSIPSFDCFPSPGSHPRTAPHLSYPPLRISRGPVDRNGFIYSLTYRVGRHVPGIAAIFSDILSEMCFFQEENIPRGRSTDAGTQV